MLENRIRILSKIRDENAIKQISQALYKAFNLMHETCNLNSVNNIILINQLIRHCTRLCNTRVT